jgi:hypothetical protein
MCLFNRNVVLEYLFSISDICGAITSMETAPANMALVCVPSTSVTNSQNMLPVTAEASLNTLSTTPFSDSYSEEITFFRLLKISPVPKKLKIFNSEKGNCLFYC